jgi:hypothetical protein
LGYNVEQSKGAVKIHKKRKTRNLAAGGAEYSPTVQADSLWNYWKNMEI